MTRREYLTYCVHPITNAVAEGVNSKFTSLKRKASSYRNPENFKTAIHFHCGGLSIYPLCFRMDLQI